MLQMSWVHTQCSAEFSCYFTDILTGRVHSWQGGYAYNVHKEENLAAFHCFTSVLFPRTLRLHLPQSCLKLFPFVSTLPACMAQGNTCGSSGGLVPATFCPGHMGIGTARKTLSEDFEVARQGRILGSRVSAGTIEGASWCCGGSHEFLLDDLKKESIATWAVK